MVLYFKAGNYKCLKEVQIINFNAASINEHQQTKLLKSIVLMGHNASGKSVILDALIFLRDFVINSATQQTAMQAIEIEPFLLSSTTAQAPSLFEIAFTLNGNCFRYGFEADRERVHKEWLLESTAEKEYPVFLRTNQDFEINVKRFHDSKGIDQRTRKNALFLSVAAQWNVQKAIDISSWFASISTVNGLDDRRYRNVTLGMMNHEATAKIVNDFVTKADLGIREVNVVDSPSPIARALHTVYDGQQKPIEVVPFILDEESEGTKKYFYLIGLWINAIREGRFVVVDELDARFHPILTKSLLKLFNSSSGSHAQLLAACHDVSLLDRELFRKDQVCFVEKDSYGATHVTSLVEFKSGEETSYFDNYLNGRYGAIPVIENLAALIK